MDQAQQVRKGEALDWPRLEAYLQETIPELKGKMSVAQFHGGHANLTYLLTFGDRELVLRRPPFGKIAPGAHDMSREYQVLSKLYRVFPQAPRAYHLCEDESIIGAKFILMERRCGVVIRQEVPEIFQKYDQVEARLSKALVKALAQLHKVDVEAAGLRDLGRPEGFIHRQLKGWNKRWELSKTKENRTMDEVFAGLIQDIPEAQTVSIIHNDPKFDNCQFDPDNPDEVASIFDWDMATLGDPLVDFANLLVYWPDDEQNPKVPAVLSGKFPDEQFLIEKYAEYTNFRLERINWYQSFACWKTSIILQQLYERYIRGDSTDERMKNLGQAAEAFAERAKVHLQ